MMQSAKWRMLSGATAIAIAGAAVGLTMSSTTTAEERAAAFERDDEIRVATYEEQSAFNMYHRSQELNRELQELQQEMQQAQQEGDQQRMMELQQRAQQMQEEVIDNFYKDVEEALPQVAEEHGLTVVAVRIDYLADGIDEPDDITQELMEKVNADAGVEQPEPDLPW